MNKRHYVIATAVLALAAFTAAAYYYARTDRAPPSPVATSQDSRLVRTHSPVLGQNGAPVTIVEFFDPACEACRAFHPLVTQIREHFPTEVRVVLRYAAFHEGSDVAVRILETARLQDKFEPVLEALYAAQPQWARHGAPDLEQAWRAAAAAGLDVAKARNDMLMPEITATLNRDTADIEALGVRKTPTFFVNAKPLPEFGPQQLIDLVVGEVEAARKRSQR